jgi:defect-in-organelle-trafficking protein DotB
VAERPFDIEPPSVTKEVLDRLLVWAYERRASDVYVGSGMPVVVAIDGRKQAVTARRLSGMEIGNLLNSLYGPNATAIMAGAESLPFSYETPSVRRGLRYRFRVNAGGCVEGASSGYRAVFRAIPDIPPTLASLNLEPRLAEFLFPERGLVLVTGRTGSGKSTLLAAVIRKILESTDKAVFAYEAPVEFIYKDLEGLKGTIYQSEIPRHLKDFPAAVRDSLRNAPDVVLFGEARDRETVQGAVEEVRTGHVVYTTVHTESVAGTVARMLDVFPVQEHEGRKNGIFESLRLIVHQRLAPARDGRRVALREFLRIDEGVRAAALECRAAESIALMHRLLAERGQPLQAAAERAFAQGVMSRETLDAVLREARTLAEPSFAEAAA